MDAIDDVMTTFFTVGANSLIAFNIPNHKLVHVVSEYRMYLLVVP